MRQVLWLLLLLPIGGMAQSTHSVDLTWTASSDAAGNPTGTYTIYRAPAACSTNPPLTAFLKVGTAPATATKFTDAPPIALGTYCYIVTFTVNGTESLASNLTPAVVLPAAPTGVVSVVH